MTNTISRLIGALTIFFLAVAAHSQGTGGLVANPKFNSVDIGTAVTDVTGRLTLSETVRQNGSGQNIFVGTVRSNNASAFTAERNGGSVMTFTDTVSYGFLGRSDQIIGSNTDFAVAANGTGRDLFLGLAASSDDFGIRVQSDKSSIDLKSPIFNFRPLSGNIVVAQLDGTTRSSLQLSNSGTSSFWCFSSNSTNLQFGLSTAGAGNCNSANLYMNVSNAAGAVDTIAITSAVFSVVTSGSLLLDAQGSTNATLQTSGTGNVEINSSGTLTLDTGTGQTMTVESDTIHVKDAGGGNTAVMTLNGVNLCQQDGTHCPTATAIKTSAGNVTGSTGALVAGSINVTSSTRNSAGNYTVNVTAAAFASTPICEVTSRATGGQQNDIRASATSLTSVTVTNVNDGGTATDTDLGLLCVGL